MKTIFKGEYSCYKENQPEKEKEKGRLSCVVIHSRVIHALLVPS